ncbi:DUF6328 family protein [Arthrobacter celericrescens]|uniref:DUF6328 family protein n=1 Tax=Arthrobacter celericrescens TaxID=2320851 RepID=UPI000EA084A5|nr:DUF6328 family protein [Arthrobacter celericrescens]
MDDMEFLEDDKRGESPNQKLDRNWMELLQELRVLQTGVQILAGFLLTLPFQAKFDTLDSFQVALYLFNVMVAALTTALILLPVSVHRRLFRKRLKSVLVASADFMAKSALSGVAVLIVGTALLVYDVVAGRSAALIAGGAIVVVLVFLLLVVPLWLSNRSRRPPGPEG